MEPHRESSQGAGSDATTVQSNQQQSETETLARRRNRTLRNLLIASLRRLRRAHRRFQRSGDWDGGRVARLMGWPAWSGRATERAAEHRRRVRGRPARPRPKRAVRLPRFTGHASQQQRQRRGKRDPRQPDEAASVCLSGWSGPVRIQYRVWSPGVADAGGPVDGAVQETNFVFTSPWPPGSPFYYYPTHINYALNFHDGGFYLHDRLVALPARTWGEPTASGGFARMKVIQPLAALRSP